MKSCTLVLVALLGACGDDGGIAAHDAGPRADAPPTCPPQSAPLAAGTHHLFLAFEGVAITLGDCDDSHTNCSSLVAQSNTMVPLFLAAETNRQTRITAITAMVQEVLAPFSVDVVTTRPASGSYRMVAIGGTSDAITGETVALVATKPVCDGANENAVGFVFEQDAEAADRAYADTIAGTFGALAGLVPVSQSGDCMCLQTSCAHSQACTWGTRAATLTPNGCSRTQQNDHLQLIDAVGCR